MTYFSNDYSEASDLSTTLSWSDNTLLETDDRARTVRAHSFCRVHRLRTSVVITSQASEREEQKQAMATRSAPALPGLVITAEVSERKEHTRILNGIFWRLLKTNQISPKTYMYAAWFLRALPNYKQLPKVSPDGEGGLQLAWDFQGRGRTLITVSDQDVFGVVSAGTREATYLDEERFMGEVKESFLAAIPG